MVHYKELGLVNTKELFKKAMEGGYAIEAVGINTVNVLEGFNDA